MMTEGCPQALLRVASSGAERTYACMLPNKLAFRASHVPCCRSTSLPKIKRCLRAAQLTAGDSFRHNSVIRQLPSNDEIVGGGDSPKRDKNARYDTAAARPCIYVCATEAYVWQRLQPKHPVRRPQKLLTVDFGHNILHARC